VLVSFFARAQDYTGPLGIVMVNNGTEPFEVQVGARVAQLLLERVSVPDVVEVDELEVTARGAHGFGSTGSAALPVVAVAEMASE
jgi:dUTP pyrophosphatase